MEFSDITVEGLSLCQYRTKLDGVVQQNWGPHGIDCQGWDSKTVNRKFQDIGCDGGGSCEVCVRAANLVGEQSHTVDWNTGNCKTFNVGYPVLRASGCGFSFSSEGYTIVSPLECTGSCETVINADRDTGVCVTKGTMPDPSYVYGGGNWLCTGNWRANNPKFIKCGKGDYPGSSSCTSSSTLGVLHNDVDGGVFCCQPTPTTDLDGDGLWVSTSDSSYAGYCDCPGGCPPTCGDGSVGGTEACDDGDTSDTHRSVNSLDDDGFCVIDPVAGNLCKLNTCGDGYLYVGVEDCDDGNVINGDGCSSTCTSEACPDNEEENSAGSTGTEWDTTGTTNRVQTGVGACCPLDQCSLGGSCLPSNTRDSTYNWACDDERTGVPNPTGFACDSTGDNDGYKINGNDALCCSIFSEDTGPRSAGEFGFGDATTSAKEESIAKNTCSDGSDNDCDGELDYDGLTIDVGRDPPAGKIYDYRYTTPVKGDSACPVDILDARTSPVTYDNRALCELGTFTLWCDASVGDVRSVEAEVRDASDGVVGTCVGEPNPWLENQPTAEFACPLPTVAGTYTARCFVNTAESYTVVGEDRIDIEVACSSNIRVNVNDVDGGLNGASVTIQNPPETYTGLTGGVQGGDGFTQFLGKPFGTYEVFVTKDKYNPATLVKEVNDPLETINVFLEAESCQDDCSFGATGRCDYNRCLGVEGCTLSDVDPAKQAEVKSICQGAIVGSRYDFDDTSDVICCEGPIVTTSTFSSSLAIESCSPQLIPHTTLVTYNGRIHRLTVMTYSSCD